MAKNKLTISTLVVAIKDAGFRRITCNRPDAEGADQPTVAEIAKAAKKVGIDATCQPIVSGKVSDEDATAFDTVSANLPGPVLAYCRAGTHYATLWSLSQVKTRSLADILAAIKAARYDMSDGVRRISNGRHTAADTGDAQYVLAIVGAGEIAAAASLKTREPGLEIAIIDSADVH